MESVDSGAVSMLVMLDLSAAFDTVPHERLFNRLEVTFGISGQVLNWIKSYLTNRSQTIGIGDGQSSPKTLRCGVPQGSVLGPKLFCLYTKPLSSIVIRHNGIIYHIYADDTQLYVRVEFDPDTGSTTGICEMLDCVAHISKWMVVNSLKLNADKTEIIFFGSQYQLRKLNIDNLDLRIGTSQIKPSTVVRNLGAYQDSLLTMKDHVSNVCQSCYGQLFCIRRIRKFLSPDAAQTIVRALVISRMDYCNALLSTANGTVIAKLQRVQNFAARIVFKLPRRAHITPALYELHWLPVSCRIHFKILVFVYQCLNGYAPAYLSEKLNIHVSSRRLRSELISPNRLDIPQFRTETYGRNRFSVLGPTLWNLIPVTIQESPSVDAFKKNLKFHMFKNHYTSERFEHIP